MKSTKKRAYVVAGYNITLEEIVRLTNVEVIKGKTKKLHLKMGENTGITNAEKMTDKLICFIPETDSCQYLIMSELMDVFYLKPTKFLVDAQEKFDDFIFDEWDVEQFVKEVAHFNADQEVNTVYEYCFVFDPEVLKNEQLTEIKSESPEEQILQTHIMFVGESITPDDIEARTTISVIRSIDNTLCLQYGANTGNTNLISTNHPLNYVTSKGENDLTELAKELSDGLQLGLVKIHVPIIASPDEFQIDEKFFQTYGKAAIDQIGIEKAILLLTTMYHDCDNPEYIPIPIELLSDDLEN